MAELKVRDRVQALLGAMCDRLYDKEEIIRLVLLSALAGESVFLLGPPGVAKSMIARRLKFAFTGAKAFEYLMGKFSTPDEVFGPVSIKKLKDEDKYERLTDNYLPGANIVFLDEIWKASPPIQNALLTVLNEKIFRNGEREERVDLRALIAASNELPLPGEGLEALWDRFLLRLMVRNISDEQQFAHMLRLTNQHGQEDPIPPELKIDAETFFAWQRAIDQVRLPDHLVGLIRYLRRSLLTRNADTEEGQSIYVSDRRWRKIVQLLRTSAFLHDREEVLVMDAFLVAHCIWDGVEQIEEAQTLVRDNIVAHGYRYLFELSPIEDELRGLREEIEEAIQETVTREEQVAYRVTDDMGVEFVRTPKFWGDNYAYLRVQDVNKLNAEEDLNVPLYEEATNGYRPFQTYGVRRIPGEKHKLLINQKERPLDTETVEREEVIVRAPSASLKRVWDSQITLLLDHCEKGIETLEARKEQDEPYLSGHLFVPEDLAKHVLDSLGASLEELANLKLDIQKVRHQYESVEANRAGTE